MGDTPCSQEIPNVSEGRKARSNVSLLASFLRTEYALVLGVNELVGGGRLPLADNRAGMEVSQTDLMEEAKGLRFAKGGHDIVRTCQDRPQII